MKKVRFIISICILAVCAVTLTFGAYAALSKNLTAAGTVGFSAKDCDVDVSCVVSGSVNVVDTAQSATVTANSITYSQTKVTDQMVWNVPALCFDEYSSTTIPAIVFTFTVVNNSDFSISVTAAKSTAFETNIGSSLTVTMGNIVSLTKNSSGTLTITLETNQSTPTLNFGSAFELFNIEFARI